jgi:hypothetical protein
MIRTVQTVAADLRQGEHIPKMQNDIGHKSKLRMLRQRGGKEAGGGALAAMPYRAVPGHAARRGARPGAAFCKTAVNLSQIEFGEFGSSIAKNTRWDRTDFLQIFNLPLYQLRHTSLMNNYNFDTTFSIRTVYYTILYYTILNYTILYYTMLYDTIPYYTILYYTILYCTIYYTILYYTILYYTILYYTILLYNTILYYTILYYTILYYTIL